jgi:hypothetical protein
MCTAQRLGEMGLPLTRQQAFPVDHLHSRPLQIPFDSWTEPPVVPAYPPPTATQNKHPR